MSTFTVPYNGKDNNDYVDGNGSWGLRRHVLWQEQ